MENKSRFLYKMSGWMIILIGCCLMPFVFNYMSTGALFDGERKVLYFFGVFLIVLGALILNKKINEKWLLVMLTLASFIGLELGARIMIKWFNPSLIPFFEKHNFRSYPENSAFQAHPFLQFTGKPNGFNIDDKIIPFNNKGFPGKDFKEEKNEGVYRIACFGGSTTANGYPEILEKELNNFSEGKFEVYNCGLPWYTTAHSLVNLNLNMVHYNLDAIVIHHAWNDDVARDLENFTFDYSHALKPFNAPFSYDTYLIRVSVIYRYLKFEILQHDEFQYLDESILKQKESEKSFNNLKELQSFKSNVINMIEIARNRGIKVYLTTMPTHPSEKIRYGKYKKHIDQCNEVLKEIELRAGVFVIDLASKVNEPTYFKDVAHCTKEGMSKKANLIADFILSNMGK